MGAKYGAEQTSDYGKPKGRKSKKKLQKHAEVSFASSQFLFLAIGQILHFYYDFCHVG